MADDEDFLAEDIRDSLAFLDQSMEEHMTTVPYVSGEPARIRVPLPPRASAGKALRFFVLWATLLIGVAFLMGAWDAGPYLVMVGAMGGSLVTMAVVGFVGFFRVD